MNKEPYDVLIAVTTKDEKERLSFKSSNFTEEDTKELMKFLLGEPAHLEKED